MYMHNPIIYLINVYGTNLHDSRDKSWVLDIFLGLLTDSRVPPQKRSLDVADTRTQQFLLLKKIIVSIVSSGENAHNFLLFFFTLCKVNYIICP